jgi:hypothetical protein
MEEAAGRGFAVMRLPKSQGTRNLSAGADRVPNYVEGRHGTAAVIARRFLFMPRVPR